MSHNVYSEESEKLSIKLPNYLIKIEKIETPLKKIREEIIPCSCLTTAIKIATEEKRICTLYETLTTKNRTANYLCDISVGVC